MPTYTVNILIGNSKKYFEHLIFEDEVIVRRKVFKKNGQEGHEEKRSLLPMFAGKVS